MKVITGGRQSGKTHQLIEWVKQGEPTQTYPFWSRTIICHSVQEANRLRKEYGLQDGQVFPWNEWVGPMMVHPSPEIALDNADMILANYLRTLPSVLTATGHTDG